MIPKHAQDLLTAIAELKYKPKKYEKDFLEGMKRSVAKDRRLTQSQADWLNDIYRRAASDNRIN